LAVLALPFMEERMEIYELREKKLTSEKVPVNLFKSVDFPTEGKPTRPTLASPLLVTSNPSPAPPPPFVGGARSSLRSFASLA
jgi:hypothetical protein